MIRLMLVDDEPIIRKGISTSIDWKQYGVDIVAEVSNGVDALKKARELKPHIVLSDIRMPMMNGLDLSENLIKEFSDIKIVLLSGYEEFEYAKEAIKIGVKDYLLKPVGEKELIAVITRICDEIAEELEQKREHISLSIVLSENYSHIKSNFLKGIFEGKYISSDIIYQKAKTLELALNGPRFLIFVIDIDDFAIITEGTLEREKESLKYGVMNISEEVMRSKLSGFVCHGDFERLIGLMNVETCLDKGFLDALCAEIQYCVKKHLGLSISIGLGRVYNDIQEIKTSYTEAIAALRNKIYLGRGSIIPFKEEYAREIVVPILYTSSEEKEIISYIAALDINNLNASIEKIISKYTDNQSSFESIRNMCCRLTVISLSSLEGMGINVTNAVGVNFNPYKEVIKFDTLESLRKWLSSFFDKIVSLVYENRTQKFNSIIKSVLKHIEENYDSDLSLGKVAGMVYVTPNYLSRIFKQEMGVNFVDWLNGFRVEKAKALLMESGIKSYEVAEKVGYKDYKYFSSIFKKFTGYSPKQYKEKSWR